MIVGITGHQNVGDAQTVSWIRAALKTQLDVHRVSRGLSSLAVGADQLFVQTLREASLPFEAVLPCDGYEQTFESGATREAYTALLGAATHIHRLPFAKPSEEAFFAAGKWIVSHCELLFAVWNGLPARGLGGTGDVVAYARNQRRAWVHFNPISRTIVEEG